MMHSSRVIALAAALLLGGWLAACDAQPKEDKLSIVATVYASYDFAKQLTADFTEECEVKLLLQPGGESHSYEPSPSDVAAIQSCDVFLYIGGVSENWVDSLLAQSSRPEGCNVKLMDTVTPVYAEADHDHAHDESHDHDAADEHIWTDPQNAQAMVAAIADAIAIAAPEQASACDAAEQTLLQELEQLDAAYTELSDATKGRTLVFAERFPFRYLIHRYGWNYVSPFSGCSSDTDASAAALSTVIQTVKDTGVKTVLVPENSTMQIADAICEATGAAVKELHSCNNISQADYDAGKHYQAFLWENLDVIREALG